MQQGRQSACTGGASRSPGPQRAGARVRAAVQRQSSATVVASPHPGAHPSTSTLSQSCRLRNFGFAANFDQLYELGRFLGSGSFGTVHVATERATGAEVAVKTIRKKRLGGYLEQHFARRVQHEVDMHAHLGRSLNIAHLLGAYEDDKCVDLVMQLCAGGTLWSRVRRGTYGEGDAARIVREILRAVAQCHSRNVVVRDVKPENFLFVDDSPDSTLRMIDLGLATHCAPGQVLTDRAGTPFYCAPELLRRSYGLKADVWSVGVIAYELLAAHLPFTDEDGGLLHGDLRLSRAALSNRDIFAAILYAPLDFDSPPWPSVSRPAQEFVRWLLTRDPAHRPTAAEALSHPWLAEGQAGHGGAHPTGGLDDTLVQRLQRYGTYRRLKQVSLSKVASFMPHVDSAALQQLRTLLGLHDAAPGGGPALKIPYDKVAGVLQSGQFELSDVEVRQLLSSFRIDGEGNMDVDEWLAALTDWQAVQASPLWSELVDRAWAAIDPDNHGELGVAELEALLCDEEAGCPVADTVPSALRDAVADASMDTDSEGEGSGPGFVLDRAAFSRLVRTAQQDRLELFESRRRR